MFDTSPFPPDMCIHVCKFYDTSYDDGGILQGDVAQTGRQQFLVQWGGATAPCEGEDGRPCSRGGGGIGTNHPVTGSR